jgi:hypothetical protein
LKQEQDLHNSYASVETALFDISQT